jgi:hypothetical protein
MSSSPGSVSLNVVQPGLLKGMRLMQGRRLRSTERRLAVFRGLVDARHTHFQGVE